VICQLLVQFCSNTWLSMVGCRWICSGTEFEAWPPVAQGQDALCGKEPPRRRIFIKSEPPDCYATVADSAPAVEVIGTRPVSKERAPSAPSAPRARIQRQASDPPCADEPWLLGEFVAGTVQVDKEKEKWRKHLLKSLYIAAYVPGGTVALRHCVKCAKAAAPPQDRPQIDELWEDFNWQTVSLFWRKVYKLLYPDRLVPNTWPRQDVRRQLAVERLEQQVLQPEGEYASTCKNCGKGAREGVMVHFKRGTSDPYCTACRQKDSAKDRLEKELAKPKEDVLLCHTCGKGGGEVTVRVRRDTGAACCDCCRQKEYQRIRKEATIAKSAGASRSLKELFTASKGITKVSTDLTDGNALSIGSFLKVEKPDETDLSQRTELSQTNSDHVQPNSPIPDMQSEAENMGE